MNGARIDLMKYRDEIATRKLLRVLGGTLGVVFVLFGPWLLMEDGDYDLGSILVCLNFVVIGAYFINYGATGRSRLPWSRSSSNGGRNY